MLVTAVTVTFVLISFFWWDVGQYGVVLNAYYYFLGPGLLLAVGLYIAYQSTRMGVVVVGTLFLLFAVVSIALGCPARGCVPPEGYEFWRNVKFALDLGITGPRLLISDNPGACAFQCPYTIQLIPLAIGYGALALGLSTPRSHQG